MPIEFENNLSDLNLNKYLLIILLSVIVGSFSGTSNGGLKINRISLFFINFKEELNKFLFQHNVNGVNIIKKGSSQNDLNTFYALMIFTSIILFNVIILNISGMSLREALIYIIASLSNMGEALIIVGDINDKIKTEYYFY